MKHTFSTSNSDRTASIFSGFVPLNLPPACRHAAAFRLGGSGSADRFFFSVLERFNHDGQIVKMPVSFPESLPLSQMLIQELTRLP
jgi:hypothetical protein